VKNLHACEYYRGGNDTANHVIDNRSQGAIPRVHLLIGIVHAPSRMREVRAIKLIVCALTNIYSGIDGTVHIAFVIVLFLIVSRTHSYTRFLSNTKVQF